LFFYHFNPKNPSFALAPQSNDGISRDFVETLRVAPSGARLFLAVLGCRGAVWAVSYYRTNFIILRVILKKLEEEVMAGGLSSATWGL
jgi:hypothetical protein